MVNYKNSKIYKIFSDKGDDIYIGSSAVPSLSIRMALHRSSYKRWKQGNCRKYYVFDLFEKYGIKSCHIVLIQNYPCDNKDQLRSREEWHRKQHTNVINKYRAFRTEEELKLDWSISNNIKKLKIFHCKYCDQNMSCLNKHNHNKTKKHLNNKRWFKDLIKKK